MSMFVFDNIFTLKSKNKELKNDYSWGFAIYSRLNKFTAIQNWWIVGSL